MAARWKRKPTGFKTVRRGGWWVRPEDAATPRGGRAAPTTRSGATNRLVPREFTGSEGVIGPWRREPRLDPSRYETTTNEAGRFFARPRTEFTGLDPQAVADIRGFDATTEAQRQRIREAYDAYAAAAASDASAGAQNLGTLAKLSAAGFTAPISGEASGPYGAVAARPLSHAETALPGVLSQGAREESAARSAQTIAALNQLPTIARSEGLSASERMAAERGGQRSELLSGYRQQAAESAAAEQEAQFERQKLSATLRGQNLSHLGRVLSGETQVATTKLREQGKTKDRAARLRIEAARLRQQAAIARERNLVSRANTLDRLAVQREAAAKKEAKKQKLSSSDLRALTKRAREMWEGIPRTVTDEQGKRRTEYLQYDFSEIVQELMAMGAPRSRALSIAGKITGKRAVAPERVPGLFRF